MCKCVVFLALSMKIDTVSKQGWAGRVNFTLGSCKVLFSNNKQGSCFRHNSQIFNKSKLHPKDGALMQKTKLSIRNVPIEFFLLYVWNNQM